MGGITVIGHVQYATGQYIGNAAQFRRLECQTDTARIDPHAYLGADWRRLTGDRQAGTGDADVAQMKFGVVLRDQAVKYAARVVQMRQRQLGAGQERLQRAAGHDDAYFHNRYVIGDTRDFANRMADVNDRDRQSVGQALKVWQDLGTAFEIQAGQR